MQGKILRLSAALVCLSCAAQTGEPRELRGVWLTNVDSRVLESRAGIAEAMEFLAAHHVNVVFPVVWNKAVTLYPSDLMDRTFGVRLDPSLAGRDALAEVLVEAHRRGIEVVPWFEYGFAASFKAGGGPLLAKKPAWAARDRDGKLLEKNGFEWLNALDPEVQGFLSGLVLEVARGYDVDGVQGDDRLPALPAHGGYDAGTVARWRREQRGDPPAPGDPRWMEWRAEVLTGFLARLSKDVHAVAPGLVLSSSPSPYDWGYREYLQDARTWVERGLVDLVHPQCYRRDVAAYRKVVDEQIAKLPRRAGVVHAPGILVKSGGWVASPDDLLAMVAYNRERKLDGEVLFFYDGLRANGDALARALLTGPYREEARLPYRKDRWRPPAIEAELDARASTGGWERVAGATPVWRSRESGASAVFRLSSPVTAWFTAYVDVAGGDAPPRALERTFEVEGRAPDRATVPFEARTVRLGSVQVPAGDAKLRLTVWAPEGPLALGRAFLILDRRRSPDVVWKDGT
jgi:uncharacterized lipoprotein YddW (UPF0748 family)